jgi:hypothetical protein
VQTAVDRNNLNAASTLVKDAQFRKTLIVKNMRYQKEQGENVVD